MIYEKNLVPMSDILLVMSPGGELICKIPKLFVKVEEKPVKSLEISNSSDLYRKRINSF